MRTRVRWRARAPSRTAPRGTPLPTSGARAAPSAYFVELHSRSPWSRTRSACFRNGSRGSSSEVRDLENIVKEWPGRGSAASPLRRATSFPRGGAQSCTQSGQWLPLPIWAAEAGLHSPASLVGCSRSHAFLRLFRAHEGCRLDFPGCCRVWQAAVASTILPSYGSFNFAFNCSISRKIPGIYYRYLMLPISFLSFSLESTLIRLFAPITQRKLL